MSTYCVVGFVLGVYTVFKPLQEVDVSSSLTDEETGSPRKGAGNSVISEILLGSSGKSWLSLFPFEYLGRQWGKEAATCFSFSLVKHFIYFAVPCLFCKNKWKKFLLHSWFYPCGGPGQDFFPAELCRDTNGGYRAPLSTPNSNYFVKTGLK